MGRKKMNKPKSVWNLMLQRPFSAVLAVFLVIMQAILTVAEVVVLENFIDNFSGFYWKQAVLFSILISFIYAFQYIQSPLLGWLNNRACLQIRTYLDSIIIEKVSRISVAALENKDNQALLTRLQDKPEKRYINGFFAVLQILGGIMGMVGVLGLVINHVPFFLLVILVLLGLMVVAFRLIGKNKIKLYHARQEIGRCSDYLSNLLFERRLAQEKKLFGYTHYIQTLYEEENINSNKKLFGSIFFANMVIWVYDNITYLFSASAYILFLIPLYKGNIDIGLYIAIIPALTRLGAFFVSVGSNYWPTYKEYQACFADINKLNELPEQYYVHSEVDNTPPMFHVIKGENIVFRYPGQEKPVLNGMNFAFYAGKNYALVGENGCGKTTLIKLLMGLYKPCSGRITIDGEDIQEMSFERLQSFFSAVFQDFNRYYFTIRENIEISSLGKEKQDSRLQQAAKEAEIDQWILSCADNYNTKLGNLEEGGIDLSGGQWQRLSIARMLYRKAGIYIWDEPTAAMDPLAESRLYTAFFQKRAKQNANIFVTHRLGAAVSADEICVLEKGRLVEQGTHKQLMENKDGLYYQMFCAQKGMYE